MDTNYDFKNLSTEHLEMLRGESGISDEVIATRGYVTAKFANDLDEIGFGKTQQRLTPSLVIPIYSPVDFSTPTLHQIRPDNPRVTAKGRSRKYEFPYGKKMCLDINPVSRENIRDPKIPLFITEGSKKVDAIATHGACCLGVSGVWNWRGKNDVDGLCSLGDWEAVPLNNRQVYIAFDSDIISNQSVARALHRFVAFLRARQADVLIVYLPGTKDVKLGVDDYLVKGKTIDNLISLASDVPPQIEEETHVQTLMRLAEGADLFRTPDEQRCVRVHTDEHFEIHTLGEKGSSGRDWLLRRYQGEKEQLPSTSALSSVMEFLGAQAAVGPTEEIYTRAAWADETLYIDLGDDTYRAIEVTADGYRVVSQPLVNFKRPKGIKALPTPQSGGSMELLRLFLNVEPDSGDEILIWAWLLGAVMPNGPYPHLGLHGVKGTAKSTATRVLRRLIDPNEALSRHAPKDEESLLISARNSFIVALDNISGIPNWLSDALCCLSTGAAISTRQLYTNTEESLLIAQRPVVMNGINELATRGDLLDRIMTVTLQEIPSTDRKDERTLDKLFSEKHPLILGSLLDAVSLAIRKYPDTHIIEKPRMADFAHWVVAGSEAFGWDENTFLNAYTTNKLEGVQIELQASVVGNAVLAFLDDNPPPDDMTKQVLLKRLEHTASEGGTKNLPRGWPETVNKLTSELKRLTPSLGEIGWDVKEGRSKTQRTVSFVRRIPDAPNPVQQEKTGDKVADELCHNFVTFVTNDPSLSPSLSPPNAIYDKGLGENTPLGDKDDNFKTLLSVQIKKRNEKDKIERELESKDESLSPLSPLPEDIILSADEPVSEVSHEASRSACPKCRSGRWMKTNYGMMCEACGARETLG